MGRSGSASAIGAISGGKPSDSLVAAVRDSAIARSFTVSSIEPGFTSSDASGGDWSVLNAGIALDVEAAEANVEAVVLEFEPGGISLR